MESAHRAHDHGESHGHQARLEDGIDFINTYETDRGVAHDHLETFETAVRWLFDHDLLHDETRDALLADAARDGRLAERALARIRRTRVALRELFDASVDRRRPDLDALAEVNRALRTHYVYELVPASDGVSMGHRHEGDPIDGALARLAESIAREISVGDPDRLRICANDQCRWVFVDRSRTGKRKWCDMASCGNRAKAARLRERRRGMPAGDAVSP